jgi:hypothetical protein
MPHLACDNRFTPKSFLRVSTFAEWIRQHACSLTDDSISPLCPPLLCPNKDVVLGYPWAKMPNATRRLKYFHGFSPVTVTQGPAPGTLFNASTDVTISAVDVSGHAKTCAWTVEFPPVEEIGWLGTYLENGSHTSKERFYGGGSYGRKSHGLVVKMTAEASNKFTGSEAITARLQKGKIVYNGTLALSKSRRRATLRFQSPVRVFFTLPSDWGGDHLSDVMVKIVWKNIKQENDVLFTLIGQNKAIG